MAFLTLFNRRGWSPTDVSGLLAEYRFDDGSGTQLTDYSGNGNHGTLGAAGAAPAWAATGLTFDGGDRVDIPVAVGDVKTVVFYGDTTGGSLGTYAPVLSSDNAAGLSWFIRSGTFYPPSIQFYLGGAGDLNTTYDPLLYPGGAGGAWVQDGVADKMYLNALETGRYTASSNTAASGRAGGLVVGLAPQYPVGYVGTLSGLLLYSTALTAAQVAAANAYLATRAAARGVAAYANASTTRQLYAEGDSITVGVGSVATPWTTSISLAQTWTRVNQALSGQTLAQITASIRQRTLARRAGGAAANTVVVFAGTNDGFGGATAAATFSLLQQCVGYATAAGWTCVVVPMLSRTSLDTFKNSYNTLIFAASFGAGVRVVPAAALAGLIEDNASSGGNFQDGVHPTQSATTDILAPAIATEVDAFG